MEFTYHLTDCVSPTFGSHSIATRPRESACQAVNVLIQIGGYVLPERVEDEPHAFPTCQLRRRDKIRISGDEDDDVRVSLERQRRNIQSDSHIDPLLPQSRGEVVIGQILDCKASIEKGLLRLRIQNPGSISVFPDFAKTHGDIPGTAQGTEKLFSKSRLIRLVVVDCSVADRFVRLVAEWASVVVEGAVKKLKWIRNFVDGVQLLQVAPDQLPYRPRDRLRIGRSDIRSYDGQPFQEIAAVNQNCRFGHDRDYQEIIACKKGSPRDRPRLGSPALNPGRKQGVLPRGEYRDRSMRPDNRSILSGTRAMCAVR